MSKSIKSLFSAPEVMAHGIFSKASDIFSFGIVLWELFERKIPYMGISNSEVIEKVTKGYRMPKPDDFPENIYEIMSKCWAAGATYLLLIHKQTQQRDLPLKRYMICFVRLNLMQ